MLKYHLAMKASEEKYMEMEYGIKEKLEFDRKRNKFKRLPADSQYRKSMMASLATNNRRTAWSIAVVTAFLGRTLRSE